MSPNASPSVDSSDPNEMQSLPYDISSLFGLSRLPYFHHTTGEVDNQNTQHEDALPTDSPLGNFMELPFFRANIALNREADPKTSVIRICKYSQPRVFLVSPCSELLILTV
jgi:hypothetical protein